jgi:hypothetical protein
VTEDEIHRFAAGLPGVVVVTASEADGAPEVAWADHQARFDFAVLDRLLPHPAYATQAWVSILNPGPATSTQARALLAEAHTRAVGRHRASR